jgi:hypothetical protein
MRHRDARAGATSLEPRARGARAPPAPAAACQGRGSARAARARFWRCAVRRRAPPATPPPPRALPAATTPRPAATAAHAPRAAAAAASAMSGRWGDSVDDEAAEGEAEAYEVLPETQVRAGAAQRGVATCRRGCRRAGLSGARRAGSRPRDPCNPKTCCLQATGCAPAAPRARRRAPGVARRAEGTRSARPAAQCTRVPRRCTAPAAALTFSRLRSRLALCSPRQVIGPDKHGIKTIIEFKVKEDGSKARSSTRAARPQPPRSRPHRRMQPQRAADAPGRVASARSRCRSRSRRRYACRR